MDEEERGDERLEQILLASQRQAAVVSNLEARLCEHLFARRHPAASRICLLRDRRLPSTSTLRRFRL